MMNDRKAMGKNSFESQLPIWELEQYKDWLRPLSGEQSNLTKVYCILCNQSLAPRRATLDGHAGTKKHREQLLRNGSQIHRESPQCQEVLAQQSTTLSIQGLVQCQAMPSPQSTALLKIPGLLQYEPTSCRVGATSHEPSSGSPKRPTVSTGETTTAQSSSSNIPESPKRPRLSTGETTRAPVNSSEIPESVMLKSLELKFLLCNLIHTSAKTGSLAVRSVYGSADLPG